MFARENSCSARWRRSLLDLRGHNRPCQHRIYMSQPSGGRAFVHGLGESAVGRLVFLNQGDSATSPPRSILPGCVGLYRGKGVRTPKQAEERLLRQRPKSQRGLHVLVDECDAPAQSRAPSGRWRRRKQFQAVTSRKSGLLHTPAKSLECSTLWPLAKARLAAASGLSRTLADASLTLTSGFSLPLAKTVGLTVTSGLSKYPLLHAFVQARLLLQTLGPFLFVLLHTPGSRS